MGGGPMSSTATGGGPMMLNGCTKATAKELPNNQSHVIKWDFSIGGGNGCFKAIKSVTAKFDGDFSVHPLMGGSPGNPDKTSPISDPKNNNGVIMLTKGVYGFYCTKHANMKGAFFVD